MKKNFTTILINKEIQHRWTGQTPEQYVDLEGGVDYAPKGQETEVGAILRSIDELTASEVSGQLKAQMKRGSTMKRFAIFVTASWDELSRVEFRGDREPGGFCAQLLNWSQDFDIPVICGETRKGCCKLIERYFAGESLWIGDIQSIPMPPVLSIGVSGMVKQNTIQGLQGKLLFHSIKYYDVYDAVRNGKTYPQIIKENAKKYKYFGLFYLKQKFEGDKEAEALLKDACLQSGSLYASGEIGLATTWAAEASIPAGLWQRFLSDCDSQFNKS
ncbi:MAG: hypothetical protein ACYDHG_03360 [Desulfomonilaceae bacterium]